MKKLLVAVAFVVFATSVAQAGEYWGPINLTPRRQSNFRFNYDMLPTTVDRLDLGGGYSQYTVRRGFYSQNYDVWQYGSGNYRQYRVQRGIGFGF